MFITSCLVQLQHNRFLVIRYVTIVKVMSMLTCVINMFFDFLEKNTTNDLAVVVEFCHFSGVFPTFFQGNKV